MTRRASTGTHGFLFADLRGYTAFDEAHGDDAAMNLLGTYRALVRKVVAEHAGAEIRTEGDGFFIVFPSASAAVLGGLDILVAADDRAREGGLPIAIGIGVHAGETAESEQEGLVGSAISIAARICAVAGPGELLVSDTVRGLTRTVLQVRFAPRGTKRLKGVREPIALFRVEPVRQGVGMATPAIATRGWRRAAASRPTTLALALAFVVVAVVGAAAIGLRAFAPVAPVGPTAIAFQSGSGVLSAGASFPSADDQALLERVPSSVSGGPDGLKCRQTDPARKATNATISLVCVPGADSGVQSVWYDRVADAGTLTNFFGTHLGNGPDAPYGDCATETGVFQTGGWGLPNLPYLTGRLRCYQVGSQSWIAWTYESDLLVAQAVRGDLNWDALYEWWKGVGPFLKG
jgi:class 3 adenylate cyclase